MKKKYLSAAALVALLFPIANGCAGIIPPALRALATTASFGGGQGGELLKQVVVCPMLNDEDVVLAARAVIRNEQTLHEILVAFDRVAGCTGPGAVTELH